MATPWRQATAGELGFLWPLLVVYLVPGLMILGYAAGHHWTFRIVVWVYVGALLLDSLVRFERRRESGPGREGAESQTAEVVARIALALWVPLHAGLILCGLLAVRNGDFLAAGPLGPIATLAVAVGMTGGMFGIPIAHELMHSRHRFERALAEVLMTLMGYPHFCIEHVRGHHRTVGTPADPATARLGESFYAFLPRTVLGGLRSAWRLESGRLERRGLPRFGPRNQIVRDALALVALHAGIAHLFGPRGNLFFALQGIIAFTVLEAINYVEHYGLLRREIAPGRFERVEPWHSWDSGHRISNWLMLNIARHSDHHCEAGRPFHRLRNLEEAPQLPLGYFGMFVLALAPPLWRRVMDPRARLWQMRSRGLAVPGFDTDQLAEEPL